MRSTPNRRFPIVAVALVAVAALLAPLPLRAQAPAPATSAKATAAADDGPDPPPPPKGPRRGPNPCMTPDPGFGIYDSWQNVSTGQMIAPQRGGVTRQCAFDVVVHFHGHEPIRKEFVKTATGQVLVGIDMGIGSGPYESAFADPSRFEHVLASVEAAMAKRHNRERCTIRRLALSSWSAGYGAIWRILQQPAGKKVDAVVLLDSLHSGYNADGSVRGETLEPFVGFARQAAARQKLMFLSHSSIEPPGYASTTEVARYLVKQLRGRERPARRQDVLGLDLYARFDKGSLHVRGYVGNDKPDHCAHIGLMADVLRAHLGPRWNTPRGRAAAR